MAKTPLIFGLIGFPIKHSFSPAMHNAAFKKLGINAEYKRFEVKPEELEDFLHSLREKGICGLNVTIPYKEKVLEFVELESKNNSFYVKQIKAVNTIIIRDGILKYFNTDIPGFGRALVEKNGSAKDKRIAILGAGGASRAVAFVLAEHKAKEIAIYDIDKTKSLNIVELIRDRFPDFPIHSVDNIEDLKIKEKNLLINATPIGMKPDDRCLITEEMLHKNLFVYDLIYNPPETKLLALANKAKIGHSNGLNMLLYQGVCSLELFIDRKVPFEIIEVMRQALINEINKVKLDDRFHKQGD